MFSSRSTGSKRSTLPVRNDRARAAMKKKMIGFHRIARALIETHGAGGAQNEARRRLADAERRQDETDIVRWEHVLGAITRIAGAEASGRDG